MKESLIFLIYNDYLHNVDSFITPYDEQRLNALKMNDNVTILEDERFPNSTVVFIRQNVLPTIGIIL